MAIPEGYRLLTANDIGKTFGVDLELTVYFDTDIFSFNEDMFQNDYANNLTNFMYSTSKYSGGFDSYIPYIYLLDTPIYYAAAWPLSDYTFSENVEITDFNIKLYDWNNWFYVKDKVEEPEDVSDPYNIKLTEPKLTIHCEGATMEKEIVVQVDVYDGTVEGGEVESGGGSTEEETGYTLTLEQLSSYTYGPFGDTTGRYQYSINGGEFQDFGSSPLTISNVKTVVFKYEYVDGAYSTFKIRDGNTSVYTKELTILGIYTTYTELGLALTEDTTLYVGATSLTAGGGSA